MAAEDTKRVSTISVLNEYFTIDSEPSYFVPGYRSDLYYHIKVTFYNYTSSKKTYCVYYTHVNPNNSLDYYQIIGNVTVNAGSSTSYTFKFPTDKVNSSRTKRIVFMGLNCLATAIYSETDTITIKSPPDITTTTIGTTPPSSA